MRLLVGTSVFDRPVSIRHDCDSRGRSGIPIHPPECCDGCWRRRRLSDSCRNSCRRTERDPSEFAGRPSSRSHDRSSTWHNVFKPMRIPVYWKKLKSRGNALPRNVFSLIYHENRKVSRSTLEKRLHDEIYIAKTKLFFFFLKFSHLCHGSKFLKKFIHFLKFFKKFMNFLWIYEFFKKCMNFKKFFKKFTNF